MLRYQVAVARLYPVKILQRTYWHFVQPCSWLIPHCLCSPGCEAQRPSSSATYVNPPLSAAEETAKSNVVYSSVRQPASRWLNPVRIFGQCPRTCAPSLTAQFAQSARVALTASITSAFRLLIASVSQEISTSEQLKTWPARSYIPATDYAARRDFSRGPNNSGAAKKGKRSHFGL